MIVVKDYENWHFAFDHIFPISNNNNNTIINDKISN